MRYFRLKDNVALPGRWHVGEIVLADGSVPPLRHGCRLEEGIVLRANVTHAGTILDFTLSSFLVPLATKQLSDAIRAVASSDVQLLPVEIGGQPGMCVLNALRTVRCLDEERSEFVKWTESDHRSDLAGQYRQVTRLKVALSAIPEGSDFFRIEGWNVALIVSEIVRSAMEKAGCFGAVFEDIEA